MIPTAPPRHRLRSAACRPVAVLVLCAAGLCRAGAATLGAAEGMALADYLPAGVSYDPAVPAPAAVLGHEVGERHVRHDELVRYCEIVAAASPRLRVEEYGRTHEGRRLLLVTATSPAHHDALDDICARHLRSLEDPAAAGEGPDPVIVWLGYSVHGNEASGANAALLTVYHLAAAQGAAIDALLEGAVVLVDPAVNPDGLARFAGWVNAHRGGAAIADRLHREHREPWPGGRTNHYWADLNRDWLLLTHPETRARLERFHAWLPHVLGDFHEMGTDRTFFFQPGIPDRQNPRTPPRNLELTRRLARFHARALDAAGRLYYTEESFDDFYFGKGSTYPDIHGAVGILFEQASARGHVQEAPLGDLTFPFAIRNQLIASLSTLEGALAMSGELRAFQREFFLSAPALAAADPARAVALDLSADRTRAWALIDLLLRHRIAVHRLSRELRVGERVLSPAATAIVPLGQRQYRLIRALIDRPTEFADNAFYDVSAWTLPLAFGVDDVLVPAADWSDDLLGAAVTDAAAPAGTAPPRAAPYACAFEWREMAAARALSRLLAGGVRALASTRPFAAATSRGTVTFERGAIVIPSGLQTVPWEKVRAALALAAQDGVEIHAIESGLTPEGIDLGSPTAGVLEPPRPLLLVGAGVAAYEAGEVWHELDERLGVPATLIDHAESGGIELERYTHVILVSGVPDRLADFGKRLAEWVRRGGIVLALRGGAPWAEKHVLGRDAAAPAAPSGAPPAAAAPLPYEEFEDRRAEMLIAGAIFDARLDRTHPLCFGYRDDRLALFRNSTIELATENDPFATPVRYTDAPLLAGFVAPARLDALRGKPAIAATRSGRGCVIRSTDNLLFRGVWRGSGKIFANAIFFGGLIRPTGPVDGAAPGGGDPGDRDAEDH